MIVENLKYVKYEHLIQLSVELTHAKPQQTGTFRRCYVNFYQTKFKSNLN